MSTAVESIRSEIASVIGEPQVVSDSVQCAAYAVDGMVPKYVVNPPSAEQVAAVLKWAANHDLAVIPCRNGSKLGIGNPPRRYDVALSLKQMNNIWHYEPADLTISVEPGVKFSDFQYFVGHHNLWLPLDPPAAARASLGGILATNSAGPLRLRCGAPRDMVLGMKIATTEGKVIKTGGRVVKNVAGYDMSKLLVGSYGTLGVIVEASLKLCPKPAERATFVIPTESLRVARELRGRILDSPLQPLRMVILNGVASTLVRALPESTSWVKTREMWLEAGGPSKVIERHAHDFEDLARGAGVALERLDGAKAETPWTRITDFRTWMMESYPSAVIMRAVLSIRKCEEFLSRAEQESDHEGALLASFSQIGVGVVHLCSLVEMPFSKSLALVKRLREVAEDFGGALVVERCSANVKAALDVWGTPGDDWEIMREVKRAWDPPGILAPGRFVGSL